MNELILLLIFLGNIDCLSVGPIPPQPLQYQSKILFNGINGMYYSDRSLLKERLDLSNQNFYTIIDFEHYREYILSKDECSWSDIPGKIQPMLSFITYEFVGNVTLNGTLAYQWNGCHYFEMPPAPYNYYVRVKDNIPLELNLPTVDRNISYINFQNGPPSSSVFHIPNNCTKTNDFLSSTNWNVKNAHSINLC